MGIDYPANKLDYSAKAVYRPDIIHSFSANASVSEGMSALHVCSKTLREKMLGGRITVNRWLLECYSDFAGDISFLTPRAKKKSRREKNSVHLYAPGCVFREDTRNANLPLRESFMYFKGGEIGGLDRMTGKKSKFCSFSDPGQKIMELMLEAADACALKGDKAFWKVQSLFIQCVDYLINNSVKISEDSYEIREEPVSPAEEFVMKAEGFMRQNISRNIKNYDVAEFMNMSESSFIHKFRKISGTPPNTRLLEMRVDAAKSLLLKGARLKNIAEAVGIRDEFYLSRIFKKIAGVTPSDFRAGRG